MTGEDVVGEAAIAEPSAAATRPSSNASPRAGPANDDWLSAHGAIPVNHGDDLPARLLAAAPSGHIDALLDFFGGFVRST